MDAATWYADADRDGYGDPDATTTACDRPTGFIAPSGLSDTDCDDTEAAVHPGADETWYDGTDSDCDGTASGCGIEGTLAVSDAGANMGSPRR